MITTTYPLIFTTNIRTEAEAFGLKLKSLPKYKGDYFSLFYKEVLFLKEEQARNNYINSYFEKCTDRDTFLKELKMDSSQRLTFLQTDKAIKSLNFVFGITPYLAIYEYCLKWVKNKKQQISEEVVIETKEDIDMVKLVELAVHTSISRYLEHLALIPDIKQLLEEKNEKKVSLLWAINFVSLYYNKYILEDSKSETAYINKLSECGQYSKEKIERNLKSLKELITIDERKDYGTTFNDLEYKLIHLEQQKSAILSFFVTDERKIEEITNFFEKMNITMTRLKNRYGNKKS